MVSAHTISNRRKHLGIPAAFKPGSRPPKYKITEEIQGMLGKMSDCEIARLTGVSHNTIGRWRQNLNISVATNKNISKSIKSRFRKCENEID